jgi:outer membrane protein
MTSKTAIIRNALSLSLGLGIFLAVQAAPPSPRSHAVDAKDPLPPEETRVKESNGEAAAPSKAASPPGTEEPLAEERVDDLALMDQESLESEREITALVREAAARFGSRKLTELSIRKAALLALRKNLDIQRRYVGEDIAQAALREAEAVFNPEILLSFNYDRSETLTRIQRDRRVVRGTQPSDAILGEHLLRSTEPVAVDPRDPTVVTSEERPAGRRPTRVIASQPIPGVANDTLTYRAQVSQQLPWGSNLTLAYQALDRETFFVNNSAALLRPGLTTAGSYHRPWVSSFIANLRLPLPGSKDFGPYAEQDVGIKLADLSRERAFWVAESAINNTLRDTEVRYWDLIRALLSLRVTVENRRGMEQLLAKTQKLYDLRMVTNYDKAQVDAELARLQSQEESAWNDYVVASNELTRLLNLDESQVLLPAGYTQTLTHALSEQSDLDAVTTRGSTDNPDLAGSMVDVKVARIEQERRAVRTRPDVRLSATANVLQNNGVFGYKSFGDSIGNTFSPDRVRQTYTVEYLYPWGNQALKARLAQTEAATRRQDLLVGLTNNRVYREINNAQIGLVSANERVEITARNVELAQLSYEKAVAQRELGTVTEYEIVEQNRSLLTARLNHIRAKTERKQAEAQLLAALGVLPKSYAERTAQTALDRHRLEVLAANHVLRHFGDHP